MKRISVIIAEGTERELASRIGGAAHTLEDVVSQILAAAADPSRKEGECHCGGLELAANDPSSPVEFDAETNEYQIVKKTDSYESKAPIRFCFYCGGKAPTSKREQLFEFIDKNEMIRLAQLFKGVRTFEDAFALFGSPDQDVPEGVIRSELESGKSETFVARSVVYTKLSDLADVRLTAQADGGVTVSFAGKEKKRR